MNNKKIIEFLKELSANNNKLWFEENKSKYEEARNSFLEFISVVIKQISAIDPSISCVDAKDSIYRIYRDVRFSLDKTPYKKHFASHINVKGRKSFYSGYYLHIEPNNCLIAGGVYCAPNNVLFRLRKAILENIDEYKLIVENSEFRKYFAEVGEEKLKAVPRGVNKSDENIGYVMCRDFTFWHKVPDDFFTDEKVFDRLMDIFIQIKRYSDFINPLIDESLE